jgi:hypothetical protein
MAETYGMKPRSFERHIALARERNREQVKRTADECKGHSLSYWTGKLQSAERTISQSQSRMQDAHQRLDQANATIDDPDEIDERTEAARFTVENCTLQIETYRKQIYTAQRDAFLCQQQVDRLLGNHAPHKIAQSTVDGQDVAAPVSQEHPCEPSSIESAEYFVARVMDTLEPLGLYIVDGQGHRLNSDGTFTETTIVQSPPAASTARLLPTVSDDNPRYIESNRDPAG